MRSLGSRRIREPLLELLRQDLTPAGIAFSLAVGLAVGLFPVIGTTTLLGLAVGALLRLNQPALQLANWLAYPLQLLAIVPLVRLGESLTGAAPVAFSVAEVTARASTDPFGALGRFGLTGLHAVLGWMAVAPTVVFILYHALLPAMRAVQARVRAGRGVAAGFPVQQQSR